MQYFYELKHAIESSSEGTNFPHDSQLSFVILNMLRAPMLTQVERHMIACMKLQLHSPLIIAYKLNYSESIVYEHLRLRQKHRTKIHTRRPKKLPPNDSWMTRRKALRSALLATKVRKMLNLHCVTECVVQNYLSRDEKLTCVCKHKTLPISKKYKATRIKFTNQHVHFSLSQCYVLQSDEKKFNLDGSDGFQQCWQERKSSNNKYFLNCNIGSRSTIAQGGFSGKGKTKLVVLKGRVNSDEYVDALKTNAAPFVENKHCNDAFFQQNNASIYKSCKTIAYSKYQNVVY